MMNPQHQRDQGQWRLWQARLALVAGLLLLSAPQAAWAAAPAPFLMATDRDDAVFTGKWFRRIYVEAFKRIGVPMEVVVFPLARISDELDQGRLDGEMFRIYGYANAHPDLVRVEEPVLEVKVVLYTAVPTLRITRLEDLAQRGLLLAEFRRGVGVCESVLKQWLPPANVSNVTGTAQALRKLVEGRTDVFCDFDLAVADAVNSPELADLGRFSQLLDVGAPVQFFGYLHKKHAALAPRLAETVKKMKAEGLIERYRVESEKDSRPKR